MLQVVPVDITLIIHYVALAILLVLNVRQVPLLIVLLAKVVI